MGLEHTRAWMEKALETRWAKHASLMYFSRWLTAITPEAAERRRAKGMRIWHSAGQDFGLHSLHEQDTQICQELYQAGFDFHIHIHHEFWCSGPVTKTPENPVRDAQRMSDMVQWLLGRYQDLKIEMKDWCFVHGCWALNASDRDICQITNECELLLQYGCAGDFSFPAGRPWCDPAIKHPFTIVPLNQERCYDHPDAKPLLAMSGNGSMNRGRFLVWSTEIPTNFSSLDNMKTQNIPPERAVYAWLNKGTIIEGTLFFKTHCHSLWHEHWKSVTDYTSSLLSLPAKAAFNLLYKTCDQEQVPIEHWTVRQVLNHLRSL